MGWCSYVLESLVKECTGFSASDRFNGPVLLLVLIYVNSTVSKKVKVEKTVPAFKAWSLEFIKPKKVNKKKKLKSITEDEDETPEKVEQKEDFHYKTFEEMKKILKDNLLKGRNLMEDTDNKLDKALAINSDDEELKNIIKKRNELFNTLYKDNEEKDDDDEETDRGDDDDAPDGDNDDKDDDEIDRHNDDKDDDKTNRDNHDESNGDNDE
ncbi:hypothetical protein Tco_0837181 [Tanacetum coccineum]